jgi:hypothetical protein
LQPHNAHICFCPTTQCPLFAKAKEGNLAKTQNNLNDMSKEFPQIEHLIKSLENLNNLDLGKISYDKVCSIILNEIKLIPKHSRTIQPTTRIYRGRLNNGSLFISEQELSYNPNPESINKFGRFNIPFQQTFYGSLILDKEENIVQTIFGELQNTVNISGDNDIKILTVGTWEAIKEFEITSTLFEETNANNEIEENSNKKEEINLIIDFFSKQIKKANINNDHNNYKITAAYANYALSQIDNCFGIVYHSVENVLLGRNIILKPYAVDNFLNLIKVQLYMIIKGGNGEIRPIEIMYTTDLGNYNSSFKWQFKKEYIDLINNLY